MTPSDFSKAMLALACWRAAKDELHSVMLMTAMVFRNRALYHGTDVYEEAATYLKELPDPDLPDVRDPQFGQMLVKLDGVAMGLVQDKTGGARWFTPKSNLEMYGSAFSITTTAGNLVFLR